METYLLEGDPEDQDASDAALSARSPRRPPPADQSATVTMPVRGVLCHGTAPGRQPSSASE